MIIIRAVRLNYRTALIIIISIIMIIIISISIIMIIISIIMMSANFGKFTAKTYLAKSTLMNLNIYNVI